MNPIKIYHAELSDMKSLQDLYLDTVSAVCDTDYNPNQIAARLHA